MEIIINITLETLKNAFAYIGLVVVVLAIGYGIAKAMRKIKAFRSKTDILIKSKEDK